MVTTKRLTDDLSVAAQPQPDDMAELARAGFKTVINNRPDGESEDQPSSAQMEAAARTAGLHYIPQPVVSGQVQDSDADTFAEHLANSDGPVLAFCRTGTRCTTLWALSQAGEEDAETILATARQAGYDLGGLLPRLQARSR